MIALPLALCFILGITCFSLKRHLPAQRLLTVGGSFAVFLVCLAQFIQIYHHGTQQIAFGNWEPPFGIALRVDLLSAVLIVTSALVYFCGAIGSISAKISKAEARGYYPLFHFLMLGILGAFSTGDLFNLYVWFEVLLLASFFLVTAQGRQRAFGGGFKYVVINIVASLIFLSGIALVYSGSGTLNLWQLSQIHTTPLSPSLLLGVGVLSVAFLIKAAIFPFYFWLPAAYPLTATPIVAVFSGLLTKVGIYGLLRVLAPFLADMPYLFQPLLQVLALTSMVVGVLGALAQENMKGILAFHSVSQLGYILLAFTLNTEVGIAACVFYMVHHMLVKSNLFLVVSCIETREGNAAISKIGGLLRKSPFLAVMFAVPALSLAGIPPLMGFWAKVFTIQGLVEKRYFFAILVSLGVSLMTMMSMLKIWLGVFWKPAPVEGGAAPLFPRLHWIAIPLVVLMLATIALGLLSDQGFQIARQISTDVLREVGYENP